MAPLSLIISTQAASDGDLLSILIDDAVSGADPCTVVKLYTAPPELDPFSEKAIRSANPAFGTFLNARETLAMAADAKRMPARENEYRNLILRRRSLRPMFGRHAAESCSISGARARSPGWTCRRRPT
jgi:hypothetical protein